MTCEQCERPGREVTVPGTVETAVLCGIHHRQLWWQRLTTLARSGDDLADEPVHVRAAVEFLRSDHDEIDEHTAHVWAELIADFVPEDRRLFMVQFWFRRVRGGLRRGPARFTPREQKRGVGVPVPWPITSVESRGGTWVRISHRDGVTHDTDLSYLLGKSGVFAALTAEIIATAQPVDGDTVGFHMPDGSVLDLAPDALWEHAVDGRCTGSCGWKPEHTRVIHNPAETE